MFLTKLVAEDNGIIYVDYTEIIACTLQSLLYILSIIRLDTNPSLVV